MDHFEVFHDVLVNLFQEIMDIEEKALITDEFHDISVNDMHVMEAIGEDGAKNMSSVAKSLSVTVGTLTIAVNNLVKKGYVLMSGAFALCIVLFLAFTTVADFLAHALFPPPWTPELSVVSSDNTCSIPHSAADAVLQMDGVKRVYGRMFVYNISMTAEKTAEAGRTPSGRKMANLISYEKNQFAWAEESLAEGSVKDVSENPGQVLYVAPPEETGAEEGAAGAAETGTEEGGGAAAETNGGEKAEKASAPQISVGDRLTLAIGGREQTVTVAGILSESPLARQEGTATLLVSERTFLELTGEQTAEEKESGEQA